MRPEIETILEEFEALSLDDRIYLDFVSDEELPVRVQFLRSAKGRSWSIWYPLSEAASKQTVSRTHFPMVLRAFGVSNTEFEKELGGILLTQAAYADEFVRQVSGLFGAEAVRMSISQTQSFMNELREALPTCSSAECETAPSLSNDSPILSVPGTGDSVGNVVDKKSRFRVVKAD
jgi:hypothetical protein